MPSTDVQRTARYGWKLIPSRVETQLTAAKSSMSYRLGVYMPIESGILAKIKGILSEHATPTFKYAGYLAFALQIWRMFRLHGGAAQAEISYAVTTWTGRGFTAATLAHIRDIITGASAP